MGTPTVLTNGTIVTGFAQLDNCALYIDENGLIGDIFNMQRLGQKEFPENTLRIDVQNAYIIPGMIDSHIHGIGGFGTEDCSPESILGMSERLADYGVSAFLPTVYTNLPEDMIKAEKAIVQAMGTKKAQKSWASTWRDRSFPQSGSTPRILRECTPSTPSCSNS